MITNNVAISDPLYEIENLRYLTVKSSFLKGRGDVTAFVPPDCKNIENLPVTILLHGVNASHWAWTRQMNVHNIALEIIESGKIEPMILVMPSDGLLGGGSGYLKYGDFNYEKWITEDVIQAVCLVIPQARFSSNFFISGLSMGGYGSLRLGCKYGNKFKAVTGHSSITNMKDLRKFIADGPTYQSKEEEETFSVINTIIKHKEDLPFFRFDCGTEDELINSNRALHQQLLNEGIAHEYEEFPGGHTGEYWSSHIKDSLLFFNQF